MVYTSFDKNCVLLPTQKRINSENQQLAEELHTLIIRKFRKRKVHPYFRDSIWDADLDDLHLISTYDEEI